MNLLLPPPLAYQIKKEAQQHDPTEICGFVAGNILADGQRQATTLYPVPNCLASSTQYQMEPAQQIQALFAMERKGQALLAIYHSHPHSLAFPSETDLSEITYPQAWVLILGLDGLKLFRSDGTTLTLVIK